MTFDGKCRNWIKFIVGTFLLVAFAGLLASGVTPPGIYGEVLRHNQELDIDASPFWYGDVENMQEYEVGIKEMRKKADTTDSDIIENTVDASGQE